MNKLLAAAVAAGICASLTGSVALADPAIPAFYEAASQLRPEGALGQVVAKEVVATAVPGAEAWRIAYVSSDLAGRKTLATALVVAPTGPAPAEGRPVMAWAHGTTGTAGELRPLASDRPRGGPQSVFLDERRFLDRLRIAGFEAFVRQGHVVVGTAIRVAWRPTPICGRRHSGRDVINAIRAAGAMKGGGRRT